MTDEGTISADPGTPPAPLAAALLRWRCDPAHLAFETSDEIDPVVGVIGQATALDALKFGLATRAPGQNIFVRGMTGTGRMTMLRHLLEELGPAGDETRDRCYVHCFAEPERPRLVTLPSGRARGFARRIDELADFVRDDLADALGAEGVTARRTALEQQAKEEIRRIVEPFEADLRAAELALVTVPTGPVVRSMIFPVIDDAPVPPEEFEQRCRAGTIDERQRDEIRTRIDRFDEALREMSGRMHEIRHRYTELMHRLIEDEARSVLKEFVQRIAADFPEPAVAEFLEEVTADIIERRLHDLEKEEDFTRLYRVNVVRDNTGATGCPIIVENTPSLMSLLGMVERDMGPMGLFHSDHMMIRAGSLLRADGGFLIMEASDLFSEAGAWKVLVRTLRTGRLEIVPPELAVPWLGQMLKPEPIDVAVKVILIGSAEIYHVLDELDGDFPNLFKVLADFDSAIPRDEEGIRRYAGVLARLVREEGLLPLDRGAVAALIEHGARIAARSGKLTARFGRVADLAREASFLAAQERRETISGDLVGQAVRRAKARADLPSRRFREYLADGTIRVETRGRCTGQINGLAVLQAGPVTFGFPARITATIGPGSAGVINIEREAALSGAIHTKGFYILGGLLRFLLQTNHPLAFDASVAFEQSYGGIDGDSASGAEICCLLSALTGVPLRQDLAMTGAIDQLGHVLAVGAVDEKIEGFHDTCRDVGLTGEQGVIIPRANAGDLMLREDVVEACRAGRFHVHAVERVHDALALLTGLETVDRDEGGAYPAGSLLALAVERAREFWLRAAAPTMVVEEATEET